MQNQNINTNNLDASELTSSAGSQRSGGSVGFRNLAAFHELLTRNGMCCPNINSKFVNKESLSAMYMGKIFNMRQQDVVYRECVKPPSKLVLI